MDISHLRGRQVSERDFFEFDHIVALDLKNLADLQALRPEGSTAAISLLLDHVNGRQGQAVADPYYGGDEHFDVTWADVTAAAEALAQRIAAAR